MAFARHQFDLSKPQTDGEPLIAHLKVYEETTGRVHPMIEDTPPLPEGLEALWIDFLELHTSRGSTGFGLQRITFTDLKAWQEIRRTQLAPWEVDLIRKADDLWLSEYAPKPKADA